jgi:hypothetical protein
MNCNNTCNGSNGSKGQLVRREQNLDAKPEPPRSLWSLFYKKEEKCVNTLTGTTAQA